MSPLSIIRSLALLSAISVIGGASQETIAAAPEAAQKTVNINQASAEELARLPRVGTKLAERIVTHRTQHGPFKRAEDLMAVKGVGEKMFTSLKPYLSVSGTTSLTEKVSSGKNGSSATSRTPSSDKSSKKPQGKSAR
jgi:competence protein ComEA